MTAYIKRQCYKTKEKKKKFVTVRLPILLLFNLCRPEIRGHIHQELIEAAILHLHLQLPDEFINLPEKYVVETTRLQIERIRE